jgi:predicted Rossmann-fold nucleotide-binding protein
VVGWSSATTFEGGVGGMAVAATVTGSGVMALVGGGSSGIMQALHKFCTTCGGEVDG